MGSAGIERGLAALRDSVDHAVEADELFERVAERLRALVPFDGSAWFATDPATVLATAPVRIENVETGHCERYWEREHRVEDVLLFRDLARSETGIGTLYEATDHTPARSARSREFLQPQGYGDELRATFRTGQTTWGVVSIFRERSARAFTSREVEVVRATVPVVGRALRAFSRGVAAAPGGGVEALDLHGTALYDHDGRMLSLDEPAERWMAELAGPAWRELGPEHSVVNSVVARAPMVASGRERAAATARLRTRSGRWLVIQASCLRLPDGSAGPIAVTIGPAKSAQIAPIIVEAYGLTSREQEITQAVARGLSNVEIAASHHLSPYTVRDHLKAIFVKVGVGTRGELVAKLFADHYAPALHAPGAAVHTEV